MTKPIVKKPFKGKEARYYTSDMLLEGLRKLGIGEKEARVYIPHEAKLESVTSVAKYVTDKSGALMGWAGKEIIRFVTSKLEDVVKGTLILTEEMAGQILADARKKPTDLSTEAKDFGTACHEYIEKVLREVIKFSEVPKMYQKTVKAYMEWAEEHAFTPLYLEQVVFSKKYGYAGRIDAIGSVDGVLAVIDWKTSKAIYPEHEVQVEAYRVAYNELAKKFKLPPAKEKYILRLPKEESKDDGFEAVKVGNSRFKVFLAAQEIFKFNHK